MYIPYVYMAKTIRPDIAEWLTSLLQDYFPIPVNITNKANPINHGFKKKTFL